MTLLFYIDRLPKAGIATSLPFSLVIARDEVPWLPKVGATNGSELPEM